jgi:hypothetical protein
MTPSEEVRKSILSQDEIRSGIAETVLRRHYDLDSIDDSTVLHLEDDTIDSLRTEVADEEIARRLDSLHNVRLKLENRHRDMNQWFLERSINTWKKPYQLLEDFIILSLELGIILNDECRPQAAAENRMTFEALIRIQGRACLIAQEVLALMKHGFPDGANARWRSLFELSIVSKFIVDSGNRTAEQYLAHDVIQSYKVTTGYQEHAERLGYPKESQDYIDKLKQRRDDLCAKYGAPFAEPYGWASEALGVSNKRPILFNEIERAAGMQHMQPYYRLASHPIHDDAKGLYFSLGHNKENFILAGPTINGMADPGQNTAISLFNVNLSLLQDVHPSRPSAMIVMMFEDLREKILEAFIEVHRGLEPELEERGQ